MQEISAGDPYLRPNGLGGYRLSVSAMMAFSRCGLQKFYDDRARHDPDAPQPRNMSATIYGSVLHHVFMLLEKWNHNGEDHVLERALATFEHYWQADNLHELQLPRINEWLRGQTWAGLRERGRLAIRDHHSVLQSESDVFLLALEYEFAVPLVVDQRVHTLYGFVDKLTIRKYNGRPYISVEDFKSGTKKKFLRYDTQFTGYAYASTLPEFWTGWDRYEDIDKLEVFDAETMARITDSMRGNGYALTTADVTDDLPLAARRGWWINLKDYGKSDCGWRTDRDYARLRLAAQGYVAAREAQAYPITNTGDECVYCPFRQTCGGVGLPPDGTGAP